jgi:biotin carboxyl carrier protein
VLVQEETQTFNVQIGRRSYEVETSRGRGRQRNEESEQFVAGKWTLRAPLSGVIVEVRVAPGDAVERGAIVLVIEAMKMLNELRVRVPGVVSAVMAAARDRVEIGTPLLEVTEVPANTSG